RRDRGDEIVVAIGVAAGALVHELVEPGVAAAEQEIVRAGAVNEVAVLKRVGDQGHHRPGPGRDAPELIADTEMAAADDARAGLPELLPRVVDVEGDEVGDLRPLGAAHAQNLALRDANGAAGTSGDRLGFDEGPR